MSSQSARRATTKRGPSADLPLAAGGLAAELQLGDVARIREAEKLAGLATEANAFPDDAGGRAARPVRLVGLAKGAREDPLLDPLDPLLELAVPGSGSEPHAAARRSAPRTAADPRARDHVECAPLFGEDAAEVERVTSSPS
jgi:hypothetical protein